jgi:hypothetical protein
LKPKLEARSGPGEKSLTSLLVESNAIKRQLKPKKTASSKKLKTESILSSENNLTASHSKEN